MNSTAAIEADRITAVEQRVQPVHICRDEGIKNGLMLIENFDLTLEETKLMDQFLPEILSYAGEPEDVLMAYYCGRNNEDPDEVMRVLSKHINQ